MQTIWCTCLSIMLLAIAAPTLADWEVVYQTDFSSDPSWTTNYPAGNYWNAVGQNYHTATLSSGGQYAYVPVPFVQGKSYQLEFDLSVANVDIHGGRVIFGLGDSDMARYEPATFYVGYWNSSFYGEQQGIRGNVLGEFYMNSQGVTYHPVWEPIEYFSINTWYHNVLTYDYAAGTMALTVTNLSSGSLLGTQFKTGVGTFLGIDRLYISSIGTDTDNGKVGEGYIDNVVLSTLIEDPCELAILRIKAALAEKADALKKIDAALEKEQAAYKAINDLLDSQGDSKSGDVLKAKAKVFTAMIQERACKTMLQKSIGNLYDSLAFLGLEPEDELMPREQTSKD